MTPTLSASSSYSAMSSFTATELFSLLRNEETETVKEALTHVSFETKNEFLSLKTPVGHTPLLLSAQVGWVDMVATLLEQGADIHARDLVYGNILHNAVAQHTHTLEMFELLFAHADCEPMLTEGGCTYNDTVFDMLVCKYETEEAMQYLINRTYDLNILKSFESSAQKVEHLRPSDILIAIQEKIKAVKDKELLSAQVPHVPEMRKVPELNAPINHIKNLTNPPALGGVVHKPRKI